MEALALDQWKIAENTSADIPKGCHITELGVLPTDWRVSLLPEVCRFRGGKTHEQFISSSGAYACVNSKFISSDAKIVKFSSENHCAAKIGDILMVMSDLPNGKALAKAFVADRDNYYAVNQRVCALTPYRDSSRYLYYALNRHPYFLKFDDGVNQTHLLNPVFKKCPVALPPTVQEQQAIAEALSDADALIEGLEKLIAKKRLIKQGAMQELLTGKCRLPGFSGDWKVRQLGEIAQIVMGQSPSSANYNVSGNGLPLIQGNADVSGRETIRRVYTTQVTKLGKRGDILLSVRAPVGEVARATFDHCLGRGVCAVRCDSNLMYHVLIFMENEWAKLSKGSTFDSVNSKEVNTFEVKWPPDLGEQQAIVAILDDLDSQISNLGTKLSKARQIKQGMMQELLTGRIRLV